MEYILSFDVAKGKSVYCFLDSNKNILIDPTSINHLKDTKLFKIINSIPGFGEFSTALFLAEVGDITRFNERKQFISFIGIDSVTSQSGVSAYHGSISKTGNKLELFYLILLQLYFKYELVVIKPILFICFSEKNNLKASIIINA